MGEAKARFHHKAEDGWLCRGKGLAPGGCEKGRSLGLCPHPAHGVIQAPEKGHGTDMLLLSGVVLGQVCKVRAHSEKESRRFCSMKIIK